MQDTTSIASPIYYAGLMALAQQRGLKTIAWAQGIGPLNRSLTQWLTRQVLLGCDGISVRDRASESLLNSWQINPVVAPDPVWALQGETPAELPNTDKPTVAVVLRSQSFTDISSTQDLNSSYSRLPGTKQTALSC